MNKKLEELARNFAELAHTGRDGYAEYNTNRMAFLAGARAVLKEARLVVDDMQFDSDVTPDEFEGACRLLKCLESLFKEEDHEHEA